MKYEMGFEKEYKNNSYHLINHVAQNNDLLKGKFRIALPNGEERPLKIKELLTLKQFISLIDIEKPHIYLEIRKKDNIRFVHDNSNNKLHNINYTRCQEYCNNLKEAYFILEDTKVKVFEKMKWDKNTNYVGYSFTREMFKYLSNQKNNFTIYQIRYLKKLKSINEIKLYEY